jgi:hypothetical protein
VEAVPRARTEPIPGKERQVMSERGEALAQRFEQVSGEEAALIEGI